MPLKRKNILIFCVERIMKIFDGIISRRSVRLYNPKAIEVENINKVIEAATWAPSGKNGQPWKFKVTTEKNIIEEISKLSVKSKRLNDMPRFI